MKYKVGDKVILGTDKDSTKGKKALAGTIATIDRIYEGDYHYPYSMKGWCWRDSELKPANNRKLVITTNGDETLARLYEDNKVVKTATAKCAPEDTFDFETGAKLAFERLMGEEKPKSKYKAGDKVKVIGNTCCHFASVGEIITLTDDNVCLINKTDTHAWHCKEYGGYIVEDDFEPYKEPVFKVGDLVKVTDTGKRFTTYTKWVENHAPEFLNRYNKRDFIKPNDIGVIRVIAPHSEGDTRYGDICIVECSENRVFLIGHKGIEKA